MKTLTNRYFWKDLTDFHPNIISVASIPEADLAAALAAACRRSTEPSQPYCNPEYVRGEDYPFMPELADALCSVMAAQAD